MQTLQIYDRLLQFPLFFGLGMDDLTHIAGHTRFDFRKYAAGKRIVNEGQSCNEIMLLTNGRLLMRTSAFDHSYSVEEETPAPYAVQPECLFGLTQRYRSTFTAMTDTNLIVIGKKELERLCDTFTVVRMNLANTLATQSQRLAARPWRRQTPELCGRITSFIVDRCQYPAGRKTVRILMSQLANELNDNRQNVSKALNDMQRDGLICLHRGRIEVSSLEKLISGQQ